jgi:hypothetical protein
MIFELMSKGTVVRLPDDRAGLPEREDAHVLLLLPYNRFLLGTPGIRRTDEWVLGKLGSGETTEVFLYDSRPVVLSLGDNGTVTLSNDVVANLRSRLFEQMLPPGEHLPAALIVRSLIQNGSSVDDEVVKSEQTFFDALEKDEMARMAYWGIRFALVRGDYGAVTRIKTWLKNAAGVFEEGVPPRVWFSLTDLPGRKDIGEMETYSFTLDDLQRMHSQSSRPVVLYSKTGYLILAEQAVDNTETSFRIWMYLPVPIWNELREKRKLSIREIVSATWGYIDALDAIAERGRYGVQHLSSVNGATK